MSLRVSDWKYQLKMSVSFSQLWKQRKKHWPIALFSDFVANKIRVLLQKISHTHAASDLCVCIVCVYISKLFSILFFHQNLQLFDFKWFVTICHSPFSIPQDHKLKHMAELQQSVVTDQDTRHQIQTQILQWEENLERLHCEQFRLRCYMASLQSGELPNPKVSTHTHTHILLCVYSSECIKQSK